MHRRPISPISIRSSIGVAYRHISRARSATSMSRRADGSGSPIFTVIFFAPSASLVCAVHNAETGVHGALRADSSLWKRDIYQDDWCVRFTSNQRWTCAAPDGGIVTPVRPLCCRNCRTAIWRTRHHLSKRPFCIGHSCRNAIAPWPQYPL